MPSVCFLTAWRPGFRHVFALRSRRSCSPCCSPVLEGSHEDRLPGDERHSRARSRAARARPDAARLRRAQQGRSRRCRAWGCSTSPPSRRPGTSCDYFEAEADGKEPADVYDCDLVAISTFSAQVFEAYAIADRLRQAGVKVAMGGLHVTRAAGRSAAHADYVIVGEGENVWPAVVEAAARGDAPRIFNAGDFPPGRRRRTCPCRATTCSAIGPYNRFTVQTSRGCPWRCDFCASTVMLGRPVPQAAVSRRDPRHRRRPGRARAPVHRVRRRQHLRRQGLGQGAVPPARAARRPLVHRDRHLGGRRPGAARPDARSRLPPGADRPGEPGGPGAGRHRIRDELQGAARRPGTWTRCARIQSHGITVNGCFILGLDGHTPDIFEEVLDVCARGAALRRADHRADAVPRHAALRPAAARGPRFSSRAGGTCARCST